MSSLTIVPAKASVSASGTVAAAPSGTISAEVQLWEASFLGAPYIEASLEAFVASFEASTDSVGTIQSAFEAFTGALTTGALLQSDLETWEASFQASTSTVASIDASFEVFQAAFETASASTGALKANLLPWTADIQASNLQVVLTASFSLFEADFRALQSRHCAMLAYLDTWDADISTSTSVSSTMAGSLQEWYGVLTGEYQESTLKFGRPYDYLSD